MFADAQRHRVPAHTLGRCDTGIGEFSQVLTGSDLVAASISPGMTVRQYRPSDQGRVLELVNADRMVGQPVATPEMLEEALAGRSSMVDAGWWAELTDLVTEVLVDDEGIVQGCWPPRCDPATVLAWCCGATAARTRRSSRH